MIGQSHIKLAGYSMSWWRCQRSLSAEYLIRTNLHGFHAARKTIFIKKRAFCTLDVCVNEPQQAELKVDGNMISKEEDMVQVTDIS